ncbi:MAG: hypothetical protein K1X64_13790 [Myxococcaceae bacterium]|nr:hypothetical protein [Myxococcaceae bacterium]
MTKIEAASEDSATNTLDPMVHLVIKQLTAGKKEKYRLSTEGADIIRNALTERGSTGNFEAAVRGLVTFAFRLSKNGKCPEAAEAILRVTEEVALKVLAPTRSSSGGGWGR